MKNRIILSITLLLLVGLAFSAYSKDTTFAKDSLLYVQDHAGENFLVLKVESCSMGDTGAVHCAMKPQEQSAPVQAGPAGGFFGRLAYPG